MNVRVIIGMGIAIIGVVIVAGFYNNEFSIKPSSFGIANISKVLKGPASQNGQTRVANQDVIPLQGGTSFTTPPGVLPGVALQSETPKAPAFTPTIMNVAQPTALPVKRTTPPNFLPPDIQLSEGHWQGMDVGILTAELRQKLRYPKGLLGLIIDEVTLNAARSGFLAGDIITHVAQIRVTTLEEFQQSSRSVRGQKKATLVVMRKGEMSEIGRFSMYRVSLVLSGDPDLGFAQMETAPMIVPGDGRPHPYRGACTNCHSIGVGFELTPDPDMINLPPPKLTHATVVKEISPHRDRGPCEACHLIIR